MLRGLAVATSAAESADMWRKPWRQRRSTAMHGGSLPPRIRAFFARHDISAVTGAAKK
jgi:hypothetical protein